MHVGQYFGRSVCLYVCMHVGRCQSTILVCLSVSRSVCPSVRSVMLSISFGLLTLQCLIVYRSACWSVDRNCWSARIRRSVRPFICICICLCLSLSFCLCVSLSLSLQFRLLVCLFAYRWDVS